MHNDSENTINVDMATSTVHVILDAVSAFKYKLDEIRQKTLLITEELFNVYDGISADRGVVSIEHHLSAIVSKLNTDVQRCDEIIRCFDNYQNQLHQLY